MPNSFRIGEFHVEPPLHSVSGPAGSVSLEPKVMLVLVCLAEHGDQVVPKERLMRAVWPDTFVGDDVLTRAISELRRVFGDDVRNPRFIQTIPKSGYRLMAPVSFTSRDDDWCRDSTGRPNRRRCSRGPTSVASRRTETDRARVRPRVPLRSWKRGLATMAVVAAVLLVGCRRPADDNVALRQSRPLGPAHLYRPGRLASDRHGLLPGARHRRRARVLHADDREPLHARTVLSGRRGGRHHPNAVQSRAPPERVAGRIAAAGPRLRPDTAGRHLSG